MEIYPNVNFIELESTDEVVFVVPVPVARQSQLVKRLLENKSVEGHSVKIPVTADVLRMVITYCQKLAQLGDGSSIAMYYWDMQFADVGPAMLDGLLSAAIFMEIDLLYAVVCEKKSEMMKCKGNDNGSRNSQGRSKKPRISGPGF